jgi:hypothetical protein
MAIPPAIRIRGARTPAPPGTVLGRTAQGGKGDIQFLNLRALTGLGLASASGVVKALPPVGFGFTIDGLPGDHQLIGSGAFSRDVTFDGTDPGTTVTSILPAAANAVFTLTILILGVPTIVGTITFAAGSTTGAVVWSPPLDLLAGTFFSLWAPTPADATLASINGLVIGRLT